MHLLCIYKKSIILSLFKIDTLNFPMYILTILTGPLKTYVVRLHNLTSMNISFTIDHKRLWGFFVINKEKSVCICRPPALCLASSLGPGPQICIYRSWPPIYIYRPWPPVCIYRPWPPICIYQPWLRICIYRPWPTICITDPEPEFAFTLLLVVVAVVVVIVVVTSLEQIIPIYIYIYI